MNASTVEDPRRSPAPAADAPDWAASVRPRLGGVGVCSTVGLGCVVLKLCGIVEWSWWLVLAPFWIPTAVVVAVMVPSLALAAGRNRGAGAQPPPGTVYEPIHGWPRREFDAYLARNPAYRVAYDAELKRRGLSLQEPPVTNRSG